MALLKYLHIGFVLCALSVAANDFSHHPVVKRMQELANILQQNSEISSNGIVNQNIALFIKSEFDRNSPLNRFDSTTHFKHGESIIAMLKLLATIRYRFNLENPDTNYPRAQFWECYSKIIEQLITTSPINPATEIRKVQQLAEYVLDWHTFVQLLELLANYEPTTYDIEWISIACMLVIENTSHLKNSFSRGMLHRLNHVRNKANTMHNIALIQRLNAENYVDRFPFQAIMVDMQLSNRNGADTRMFHPQLKRILVEETMVYALDVRSRFSDKKLHSKSGATAIAALIDLTTDELANQVNDIAYAVELYHLLPECSVIRTFYIALRVKCTPVTILNNGLSERLNDFKMFRMYHEKLFYAAVPTTPKYLNFLTIALKLINKSQQNVTDKIVLAYYSMTNVIAAPSVLHNQSAFLILHDRNHIALYEADENLFNAKHNWLLPHLNEWIPHHISQAMGLFESVAHEDPARTISTRNKIRILLRFIVHMVNVRKDLSNKNTQVLIGKIMITYIKLMELGGDVFVYDTVLMKEWRKLTVNYPKQMDTILTKKMIKELVSKRNTMHPRIDAVFYVFFARIANCLAMLNRQSDAVDVVRKVMELEYIVGYADFAPRLIQEQILKEKQIFYNFYFIDTARYFGDLKHLVEHHIELMTSLIYWIETEPFIDNKLGVKEMTKFHLLNAIYSVAFIDLNTVSSLNDRSLRDKLRLLMEGFIQDHGINDFFANQVMKVSYKIQQIY